MRLEQELGANLDNSSRMLGHELAGSLTSPSVQAARREQAVLLADALEQLPEDYREVIILHHIEEMSVEAIARMRRALEEMRVSGVPTSLAFHRSALFHQDFVTGRYDTGFIEHWDARIAPELSAGATSAAALAAVLATRARGERHTLPPADAPWARAAREDALR